MYLSIGEFCLGLSFPPPSVKRAWWQKGERKKRKKKSGGARYNELPLPKLGDQLSNSHILYVVRKRGAILLYNSSSDTFGTDRDALSWKRLFSSNGVMETRDSDTRFSSYSSVTFANAHRFLRKPKKLWNQTQECFSHHHHLFSLPPPPRALASDLRQNAELSHCCCFSGRSLLS